jgi:hypothetical protein
MPPEYGAPTPIYEALVPTRERRVGDIERVSWLLAVDPAARTKPVGEYDLVLGPAADGEQFTVFRCRRPLTVEEGSCLVRAPEPTAVDLWGVRFRVLPCLLVPPDLVDRARSEHLLTVPPAMAGTRIPEREAANGALWDVVADRDDYAVPAPPADADGRWKIGGRTAPAGHGGDGNGGLVDRVRSLFD